MQYQLETIAFAVTNKELLALDTDQLVIKASLAFNNAFKVAPATPRDPTLVEPAAGAWKSSALRLPVSTLQRARAPESIETALIRVTDAMAGTDARTLAIFLNRIAEKLERWARNEAPKMRAANVGAFVQAPLLPAIQGPRLGAITGHPGMMALVAEFIDGLPGKVRQMTDFLEQNNMTSLRRVVHQLRGTCADYGIAPLSEPTTSAEGLIDACGDLESVTTEINGLIEVIRRTEGYDETIAKVPSRASTE
jgi:hypothetical protein